MECWWRLEICWVEYHVQSHSKVRDTNLRVNSWFHNDLALWAILEVEVVQNLNQQLEEGVCRWFASDGQHCWIFFEHFQGERFFHGQFWKLHLPKRGREGCRQKTPPLLQSIPKGWGFEGLKFTTLSSKPLWCWTGNIVSSTYKDRSKIYGISPSRLNLLAQILQNRFTQIQPCIYQFRSLIWHDFDRS